MGFGDQGNQVTPVDDGGSFDTGTDTAISISESAANALAAAVSAAAALVSENNNLDYFFNTWHCFHFNLS